ncbi:MAG: sugar phosphate isomerase/epimerase [Chloroflexi bacterium]|nr:sugar phosphate isomerase/epimerase [Chloroflexota bacterium]
MRFCLRPNAVSADPRARLGYCKAIGIEAVQERPGAVPGFDEKRQLDVRALRDHVRQFTDEGVMVEAIGLGQVSAEVILGQPEGALDLERMLRDLEAIAEVGVPIATTGVPVPRPPTPETEAEQFSRIADYYARLCAKAEEVGVRLATHSPWPPSRLGWMWGVHEFARLFAAVPSPANGYLYDNAIHHMLGEDPAAAARQLADRIAFCHIRDVRRSAGAGAAGTGYDEVFPGTGECAFGGVLAALEAVGYQGVLTPEHFPAIPGDFHEGAATAYAVGYFRALLGSASP